MPVNLRHVGSGRLHIGYKRISYAFPIEMHGFTMCLIERPRRAGYRPVMAKTTPPNVWGAARMAVRALRDIIARELAEGHPMTAIYARHKARIPASYERFRVHVAREITNTAGSRGGRLPRRLAIGGLGASGAGAPSAAPPPSAPVPSEPQAPETTKEPPKGSKAWREKHGIADDTAPKPVFTARIPDLKRLAHGDGASEE